MDYRWSGRDFLARAEDESPALCGKGFITGWQFLPTENGPGRRSLGGEQLLAERLKVGPGRNREVHGEVVPFLQWRSPCHLSKGVRSCGDAGAWGHGHGVSRAPRKGSISLGLFMERCASSCLSFGFFSSCSIEHTLSFHF